MTARPIRIGLSTKTVCRTTGNSNIAGFQDSHTIKEHIMPKPKYWDVWRSVRDTKQEFTNAEVQAALGASHLSKLGGLPLDEKYWAVSIETWHLILAYNGTDKKRYVKDVFRLR